MAIIYKSENRYSIVLDPGHEFLMEFFSTKVPVMSFCSCDYDCIEENKKWVIDDLKTNFDYNMPHT